MKLLEGESLGQYVRRLREAAGLSQRDLVSELDSWPQRHQFSGGWLHKLESDVELKQHGPPIAFLEALAGVLSDHLPKPVSINDLRHLAGYVVNEDPDEEVMSALNRPGMHELVTLAASLLPAEMRAVVGLVKNFREIRGIDPMPMFPEDPSRPDFKAVEEGKEELGL